MVSSSLSQGNSSSTSSYPPRRSPPRGLSPESGVTPTIPSDYRAFQDVFSKQAATQLPPHRPWDCAIDLQPGYKLPKGRVYPLSIPEHKAMEEYIKEALNQGYIRPSSSPAVSSFMGKKDGGLRPCIDDQALNAQTVKLPYPLPLVLAALDAVRTTSFGSGRAMSGKRRSLLLIATMNTLWCRMALPTHPQSSRSSWTRCSGSSSTALW